MINSLNCEMEITFLEYVVIIKHTLAISIMYNGEKKRQNPFPFIFNMRHSHNNNAN